MATTSIWRVNGWLGKVLIYIENPDKTENPAAYEKQGMDGKEAQGLSDVIEYAVQQKKTGKIAVDDEDVPVMQRFVSGAFSVRWYLIPSRNETVFTTKWLCRWWALSKWVATSTWYFSPHNAFASFSPIS